MKILELRQIKRAEEGLYYRRKFYADASVEIIPSSVLDFPIYFTIEMGPLGNKELNIEFIKQPDFPIIPIKKALEIKIMEMEAQGSLP